MDPDTDFLQLSNPSWGYPDRIDLEKGSAAGSPAKAAISYGAGSCYPGGNWSQFWLRTETAVTEETTKSYLVVARSGPAEALVENLPIVGTGLVTLTIGADKQASTAATVNLTGTAAQWVRNDGSGVVHLEPPVAQRGNVNVVELVPVELYSDLNNDGEVDSADSGLVGKPYQSGASEDEKDKGTEFMFANDNLSNGAWDKEDTTTEGKPADADDDDAEELRIRPGITEGEVWLDHPAISGLKFYRDKKCTQPINLSPGQHLTISNSNPFPDTVFVRAENVSFTDANNPQVEGDLKLMIKPAGDDANGIEATKMKLTIVKELGAKKYFHGARDYIFENNTKTFTHHKDYGASTRYRIVAMREESTLMVALDTYDHAADKPRLKGIDEVKANYGVDVIINGNQCFANNGVPFTDYPYPSGMTNQCDGRLLSHSVILRPPSNDTHHALGGALGRHVLWTVFQNRFSFGAGQIPDPSGMDEGMGGLSTNYGLAVRQTAPNQAIGRGTVHQSGKGIIFTATNYDALGGGASDFAADAHKSGVQPLNGGDGDDWELLFLDGSSSVGLVLAKPDGNQQTVIKGSKHSGNAYYINTYLLFDCEKPRN